MDLRQSSPEIPNIQLAYKVRCLMKYSRIFLARSNDKREPLKPQMSITLFHTMSKNSRIYHVQTSGFSEYHVFKVISFVFINIFQSEQIHTKDRMPIG